MLAGKKVVVVGGSSGIGLATAELAKREGADVIVASRNVDRLDAVAARLNAIAIPADVTSDESIASIFRRCGPVDHVVVTAYLSVRPRPNSAIVGAANGALESLARSLALELAPVRVNAVSPGIIDTPIRAAMPEEARRDMLAKTAASLPVGRVGAGEDIARQILAFMTIGFATGSIVYIDGGALIT